MTIDRHHREAAKRKFRAMALDMIEILLDNASKPGYYGEERLELVSRDGEIIHIKSTQSTIHKH